MLNSFKIKLYILNIFFICKNISNTIWIRVFLKGEGRGFARKFFTREKESYFLMLGTYNCTIYTPKKRKKEFSTLGFPKIETWFPHFTDANTLDMIDHVLHLHISQLHQHDINMRSSYIDFFTSNPKLVLSIFIVFDILKYLVVFFILLNIVL